MNFEGSLSRAARIQVIRIYNFSELHIGKGLRSINEKQRIKKRRLTRKVSMLSRGRLQIVAASMGPSAEKTQLEARLFEAAEQPEEAVAPIRAPPSARPRPQRPGGLDRSN